jgi:molecular chaperone DnaK (HSP70)
MKLGIDLGTTRTVVAYADRGNYPVVSFTDEQGDDREYFPSVVAVRDGELLFGFDALEAAEAGEPYLRSFKRLLSQPEVSAESPVLIGAESFELLRVLTGFLEALKDALKTRSNLPKRRGKKSALQSAVVAVPAHAHAAQRFLTLEAFRRAGFEVTALVNEPSAAGFEYTHRLARTVSSKRTRVIVYDLGGGTFDASLVRVDGEHHDVLMTAGDRHLGGDDFDSVLALCALGVAERDARELSDLDKQRLVEACREAKESIHPNTKRVIIDEPFAAEVSVADLSEAATPLVERSLEVMAPLLEALGDGDEEAGLEEIAGIYLVGGGSCLPLVARLLRERYGRRVHRSPYPSASTAIGLAIAADESSSFTLTDRFSRSFGVFRERDGGRSLVFDPIIAPDTTLPEGREVVVRRRYRSAHNLGHYRFVECGGLDDEGEPIGDLLPVGDAYFAFDARLRGSDDLESTAVRRSDDGHNVEERYVVTDKGLVEVEIADLDDGFTQTFRLSHSA